MHDCIVPYPGEQSSREYLVGTLASFVDKVFAFLFVGSLATSQDYYATMHAALAGSPSERRMVKLSFGSLVLRSQDHYHNAGY